MNNSRHIAFDVDDTLVHLMPLMLEHHNRDNNTNYTMDQVNTYCMSNIWKVDYRYLIDNYKLDLINKLIDPRIPDFLQGLKSNNKITLLTARWNLNHTVEMLDKNFIKKWIHYDNLILAENKVEIINKEKIDLLVDDKLETIIKVQNNTLADSFLINQYWNKDEELKRLLSEKIITNEHLQNYEEKRFYWISDIIDNNII